MTDQQELQWLCKAVLRLCESINGGAHPVTKDRDRTELENDALPKLKAYLMPKYNALASDELKPSSEYEYGTIEYFHSRVIELEKERNRESESSKYYRGELEKSHALLGRVIHQTSERWDTVNISSYFPTDNLHRQRNLNNPRGKPDKQTNK